MQDRARKDGTERSATPESAARPRAGRSPDPERGNAILAVTLEILGERGFAGLTVGEIVARARVSKSTIYRRWATKEELALAAFDRLPELEVIEKGDLIEELLALVRQYDAILHSTPLASVLPGLVSEASRNPSLAQGLRETIERRRAGWTTILARAVERGELPRGIDIERANEIITAPLLQRSFFASEQLDGDDFRHIFSVIVAGLKAVGSGG